MDFLRSNTACIVAVGPFFDKGDGVTLETALTITNERITLIAETDAGSAPTLILDNITGATSGTANDLNYITGGDSGMMQLELAAADLNRVGRMKLQITDAANHVPVFHEYFVLPQAIFDWLTGVIVPLPANLTQILGVAQSATDLKDFADDGYDPSTNKVQGVVLVDTMTTYTGNTPQTGDVFPLASTEIADIKAKTDLIPAAPASTTNITAGTMTTVTNLTNAPTAGDLTATMKASVNAEIVDALNVDTYAEPGQEAPSATQTIQKMLGYLYKFLRNKKTQTATLLSIFADDGTTVDQKATISDDATTYTHGEIGSGP